jgi:hypothetical protein
MSAGVIGKSALTRVANDTGWTTWVDRSRCGHSVATDSLGRPGLWRAVRGEAEIVTAFACPPLSASDSFGTVRGDEEGATMPFDAALREWACETASDDLPETWVAPVRGEVEDWFDADRLNVRTGSHVAKGVLECGTERFRLRFPDLVRLDAGLLEARVAWLRELCLDAQSRWQLVRFGIADGRVCAEVDLSGAPPALAEPLVGWAVEALVLSVAWLLPALAVVSDPAATSPVLDLGPEWMRGGATRAALESETAT